MKTRFVLSALALLALAGCGTIDVDVTSKERSTLITEKQAITDVRPSARLLSHNDQLLFAGITHQIASEKIFRVVFAGGEDAPASIELKQARLSKNDASLVEKLKVTYEIEVVLTTPQGKRNLTASATSTKWTVDGAMRDAIERATLDLAQQCRAAIGGMASTL